jgi:hypothetical protein
VLSQKGYTAVNNVNIEEQFRLLQRQIVLAGEAVQALRRDHRAEIDDLRLEIEVLRRYLTLVQPEFGARYEALREQVLQETDPEKS